MNQTKDQERAAYAWRVVQGCSSDYKNLAKGAGALIMSNGLMATLAFYQDKGKDHHKKLLAHILNWVFKKEGVDFTDAMNVLHKIDSQNYRNATQEALDLLRWISQFASAAIKDKE